MAGTPRGGRLLAAQRAALARRAEAMAADRLQTDGFLIVGMNVRVPGGEIDVIARRGQLLVFCEVRARRTDVHIAPTDTLDEAKCERVRKAARAWLVRERVGDVEMRFDAAAVVFDTPKGRMQYFEGAF